MPHIVVKMHSGRSEAQKHEIAEEVTRAIMKSAKSSEASISVGIEDIDPADWDAKVFEPEIAGKAHTLYKKPGYKDV